MAVVSLVVVAPVAASAQDVVADTVVMPGIDDLLAQALQATDFETYDEICRKIELQVLRDLPLIGLSTLSFTTARRGNVDLGYPIKSGYARWRFHRATKTTV